MAAHRLKYSFLTPDHKVFIAAGTACDSRGEFSGYCNADNQWDVVGAEGCWPEQVSQGWEGQ